MIILLTVNLTIVLNMSLLTFGITTKTGGKELKSWMQRNLLRNEKCTVISHNSFTYSEELKNLYFIFKTKHFSVVLLATSRPARIWSLNLDP